jgi:putative transposase
MTPSEREATLSTRRLQGRPWHKPPHREGNGAFLISAACYEHRPHVGKSPERMSDFEAMLLSASAQGGAEAFAWCVLPNHYHSLILCEDIDPVMKEVGLLHGRTSHSWNGSDEARGRKVWCNLTERRMRTDRHFWATINYVHHNPVRHGYVSRWQDWPYSSAVSYLDRVGESEAVRVWREYHIDQYGKGWDDPSL